VSADPSRDRALSAVAETLDVEFPELLALARGFDAPVIRIMCPRGHQLAPVRLILDHNFRPMLELVDATGQQVDDQAAERWRRIGRAAPAARARSVCSEHGCPQLFPCPQHPPAGDEPATGTVPSLARLDCRRCRYDGRHSAADLLRRYAVAFRLESNEIHLST